MARPPKHDWQALYDEYQANDYQTITCFAETKGIHPFAMQREFRKIKKLTDEQPNKTKLPDQTKQNSCTQQNKTEPEIFIGQCEATSHKTGQRCRKKAMAASRLCYRHADAMENQCRAKSKQSGERCKNKALPGKRVCKFHGGLNKGPAPGTQNNLKHGFFARIFPDDEETRALMSEIIEKSPLDIIWENIMIQYIAIARAQRIMFVKDKDDLTEHLKREKETSGMHSDGWEKEYELQFAWDKQASFLKAQSAAMKTLEVLIARYEELIQKGLGSEEHQLRLAKLKQDMDLARERMDLEKAKVTGNEEELEDDGFLEALQGSVNEVWADEEV